MKLTDHITLIPFFLQLKYILKIKTRLDIIEQLI